MNAKDNKGSTALIAASGTGDTEIVSMLVEMGADVNAKDNYGVTAYGSKCLWTHGDRVNASGDGADVNAMNNGGYGFIEAKMNGYTEIVSMLLEMGADVNAKNNEGRTALMAAIYYCKNYYCVPSWTIEIVSMLLEMGADVNAKDNEGSTALISK